MDTAVTVTFVTGDVSHHHFPSRKSARKFMNRVSHDFLDAPGFAVTDVGFSDTDTLDVDKPLHVWHHDGDYKRARDVVAALNARINRSLPDDFYWAQMQAQGRANRQQAIDVRRFFAAVLLA